MIALVVATMLNALEVNERAVDERRGDTDGPTNRNVLEAVDPVARELLGDPPLRLRQDAHRELVRGHHAFVGAGGLQRETA